MAFAERPFYLLPSRSPRFYLGLVIFFPPLTDCSRKTGTVLFILTAEARETCGQRLGGDNMTE